MKCSIYQGFYVFSITTKFKRKRYRRRRWYLRLTNRKIGDERVR